VITFIRDIEVHPAADLFPSMEQAQLDALYESVRMHGIRIPVVFYDGKLLDGRNRCRAAVVAGIPTAKIPKRHLPPETDPYAWAWDANCSRLDYTPRLKAAIKLKVDEESGALQRRRAEALAAANRARSEKAKEQPRDDVGDFAPSGDRSRERSPQPKPKTSPVDEAIAKEAKVSVSTVRRVRKMKESDPDAFAELIRTGKVENKKKPHRKTRALMNAPRAHFARVPRSIPALAAFLRERLTTSEVADLARMLTL
jgi:hypothetical protein